MDDQLHGKYIKLRRARLSDSCFMFMLRSDFNLTKYLPPITNYNDHCKWLKNNLYKNDNYIFIAEHIETDYPHGIISIYDINFVENYGYVGRWIMRPDSKFGFEAIFLAYKFAFEYLNLDTIFVDVIVKNKHVIDFHRSVGMNKTKIISKKIIIRGYEYDVQQFSINKNMFEIVSNKILILQDILMQK